jgi:hypothetical protein
MRTFLILCDSDAYLTIVQLSEEWLRNRDSNESHLEVLCKLLAVHIKNTLLTSLKRNNGLYLGQLIIEYIIMSILQHKLKLRGVWRSWADGIFAYS